MGDPSIKSDGGPSDGVAVEIAAIAALSPTTVAPAWRREVAGAGFDAALDRAMATAPPTDTATNAADALVGRQLTPPPGGCQCDAMVAATAPSTTTWRPVARESVMTGGVRPGDLLLLDADDPAERLHAAIVRSLTEMIAPGPDGTIQMQPIPWSRVREVRRGD